jgi:hypothetical protein
MSLSPTPGARRIREFRQREKHGEIMVTVTLTPSETGILRALNCLTSDSQLEDRAAIAVAIHKLLASINLEHVTRYSR